MKCARGKVFIHDHLKTSFLCRPVTIWINWYILSNKHGNVPVKSSTVKPVLRDHCHERPPFLTDHTFLAERSTFQYNWTCHERQPVLTDHIFVASGVVFQDRFYCILICSKSMLKLITYYIQWSLYFKTTHGTKKMWSYIAVGLKIKVI